MTFSLSDCLTEKVAIFKNSVYYKIRMAKREEKKKKKSQDQSLAVMSVSLKIERMDWA